MRSQNGSCELNARDSNQISLTVESRETLQTLGVSGLGIPFKGAFCRTLCLELSGTRFPCFSGGRSATGFASEMAQMSLLLRKWLVKTSWRRKPLAIVTATAWYTQILSYGSVVGCLRLYLGEEVLVSSKPGKSNGIDVGQLLLEAMRVHLCSCVHKCAGRSGECSGLSVVSRHGQHKSSYSVAH